MNQKKCVMCGREFLARRKDAKTCSDECRKRLSRHIKEGYYLPEAIELSVTPRLAFPARPPSDYQHQEDNENE